MDSRPRIPRSIAQNNADQNNRATRRRRPQRDVSAAPRSLSSRRASVRELETIQPKPKPKAEVEKVVDNDSATTAKNFYEPSQLIWPDAGALAVQEPVPAPVPQPAAAPTKIPQLVPIDQRLQAAAPNIVAAVEPTKDPFRVFVKAWQNLGSTGMVVFALTFAVFVGYFLATWLNESDEYELY